MHKDLVGLKVSPNKSKRAQGLENETRVKHRVTFVSCMCAFILISRSSFTKIRDL